MIAALFKRKDTEIEEHKIEIENSNKTNLFSKSYVDSKTSCLFVG